MNEYINTNSVIKAVEKTISLKNPFFQGVKIDREILKKTDSSISEDNPEGEDDSEDCDSEDEEMEKNLQENFKLNGTAIPA